MVSLTIDGRRISVEPGSTVLDAAKWLGIRIPTMCHVPGIEPGTGCFLCAVQIEGRRTLSPACGMPVAEGMAVVTGSEDIRAARKMALELLLSDHAGECVAPCAAQCPAGLDIPGFVYGIAMGDHGRAMEVIAERLALPIRLSTGRIGVVIRVESLQPLGQHRLARRHLGHHGVETLAAGGHSAVGSVVAKPAHLAHTGVVVGQLEGNEMAGNAVHQQPRTPLPDPAAGRRGGLFIGLVAGH